ncbi:glutamate 5-kinase [Iodidimonas muriae]|uniref:Glutamate 5-kinase n=1 Tax=Iodidimonas muriae TaxID=261467 RepID=A0ABQ2L6U1_9PROT|nr:glutamate 5-kinase [Iodidimonas muriae]GER06567.1 glutamate 5-kinase [Kordiimonadales bacterium JCM 17843]GGO05293.1 glutamate 5-kinase [Iodidimonas muriae]
MQHEQEVPTDRLLKAKRVVIKVGSALLVDRGRLRRRWLDALAADIVAMRARGQQVALVTSGAVGIGRAALGGVIRDLSDRQAAAAVGQIRLFDAYRRALARHGAVGAQMLLTPGDTEDRLRHLNARATMEALLTRSIIPIVNENDTVAFDKHKFGDNDRLAARVGQLISADLVVLLSDVDGLYEADPRSVPDAAHIPVVTAITPEIKAKAGSAGSSLGTGGMAAKIAAASLALGAGSYMAIANGQKRGALGALVRGEARATWFVPSSEPLTVRKQWIAATVEPSGTIMVDAGAVKALYAGNSLLSVGVTAVEGDFSLGDPVRVRSAMGQDIGIGLISYDSDDARIIAGKRSEHSEALLGYQGPDALIHRDNLAMTIHPDVMEQAQ